MKSSGFTLVELLVVIAILSLLLALSLPGFRRVREEAMSTACRANIRQLSLAFQQYEMAHQRLPYGFAAMRLPPPPSGSLSNPAIDIPGWYWPNFIDAVQYKTLRDRRILECPAKRLDSSLLQNSVLCGNYGVNRSVCRSAADLEKYRDAFGGPPLSTSTVRHPGSTLLLVDSGYTLICWWHVRDDPLMDDAARIEDTAYIPGLSINKDREFWPGQIDDAKMGRHPNKTVNVGFLDGHAERKNADDLLVEKIEEDKYRNLSPLWEP
jgi:prepilin-type N-terminal cleavage/methylation domain-containing protein/prepilin-type processing-associated H-X9-DG protein